MVTITGEAVTLANLIYGTEEVNLQSDKPEAIALAVEIMGLSNDAKADLYALLEESLTEDTKYFKAVSLIEDAIIKNKRRFPRG